MSKRLVDLANIHYGKSPTAVIDVDGEFPVFGTGGVYARAKNSIFSNGIVVARKGSLGRPHLAVGSFWPADTTFAVTPRSGVNLYWLYCQLLNFDLSRLNEATGVPSISRDWLEKIRFTDQSEREQSFISNAIQSVSAAIAKTESLIEKYQHIKAGLMHDLFTRGVLPNGQLRPRREEAPELYQGTSLGPLPNDWGVVGLGRMAQIVSGVTLNERNTHSGWVVVPYLRVANVQDGYLDLSSVKSICVPPAEAEALRLYPGDVLMNEGGDFDKLGRGSVWNGEVENCIHQNHVFRVRVDYQKVLPWYLAYHSESIIGKTYFLRSSKQSTNLASINSSQLHAYPIACPSLDEQGRIVEKLDALKRQITALRQSADCLRAQKSGLMQDLLTGKVPVPVPEHEATDG